MFWGKNKEGRDNAPRGALAVHMDEWEALAVDYVDGRLDPDLRAQVERHLAECPECAVRLGRQQMATAYLKESSLAEPPADLEDLILGEVLFPKEPVRVARDFQARRPSRWPALWQRKIRPWMPATVAVAALLIGLVSYGVFRSGTELTQERAASTTVAAAAGQAAGAAEGVALDASNDGSSAPQAGSSKEETSYESSPPSTAAPAAAVDPSSTTAAPATTEVTEAAGEILSLGAPTPMIQGRGEIVSALIGNSGSPAYLIFENVPSIAPSDESESTETVEPSPITGQADTRLTSKQAQAVGTQLTALTGLEPLDDALALSRPTFSAYLPRNNAGQFVDLLQSICASVGATLALDPAPRPAVADWTSRLLKHKGELVELSAKRTPSPSVSSWSFTTSTIAPVSPDDAGATDTTEPLSPDEAGTHLLVVILVDYMP